MTMDEKVCFVISPIGEEGSETRERSDRVYEDVIKEVVDEFGYVCKRADDIEEPGLITNQIITHIVESELVVADLTEKNPNVFYELAVRHAHRKPVIQLINRNESIPFDVSAQRTIKIDLDDFSTTRNAQEQMKGQIKQIEADDFDPENPVSLAGHIRDLEESGEPEKQQLAKLTETLNDLNSSIRSIENDIQDPENFLPPEYLRDIISNTQIREENNIEPGLVDIAKDIEILMHNIDNNEMSELAILQEIEAIKFKLREHIKDRENELDWSIHYRA